MAHPMSPRPLGFLELPYAQEWAESKRRLTQIDEDGLAKDLDALAGKDLLASEGPGTSPREAHVVSGRTRTSASELHLARGSARTFQHVVSVAPRGPAFCSSSCGSLAA